jgi:hypothetical protein
MPIHHVGILHLSMSQPCVEVLYETTDTRPRDLIYSRMRAAFPFSLIPLIQRLRVYSPFFNTAPCGNQDRQWHWGVTKVPNFPQICSINTYPQ